MDVIFTIVSRNYAALAATLMESVAAHEPAARRVVVATDGPIPALAGRATVIDAGDLDAPFRDMCVYYDALELNTAVKPYAFLKLLAAPGVDSVTYLDPDIRLFRPLAPVRAALAEAELALTPHLTQPLLGDANPNDQTILASGVYNLGFAAMRRTPAVERLLRWWADRCRFDCRVDPQAGLFTDQRWMDLAPGFVEALALIRHPGVNLAYWNLEGRTLARARGGWAVDGEPLVFFHFSGFDAARPRTLSKHQNRLKVAPGSPLADLLADYARALMGHGQATSRAIPYAHGRLAGGRPITPAMRRAALRAARAGETFPDGLGAATSAWFDEPDPAAARPGLPDITRLMGQVWRDNAAADPFDRETAEGRAGFHRWFADNALIVGADARAVDAARTLVAATAGSPRSEAVAWRDTPWRGPAADVTDWLREPHDPPRACLALLASRADLRSRFADDPGGLLAWCLGPEATAGRFAADLLPAPVLEGLARDAGPLFAAARFSDPSPAAAALRRRLSPGFGVGERARWPTILTAPLRAAHLAPVAGRPAPFVALFEAIWRDRADVQRLYPLGGPVGRFRFLRWLLAGGFAEYGVEADALPDRVRHHPLMRLAALSVRRPRPRTDAGTAGRVARLVVADTFDQVPAGEPCAYATAAGGFRGRPPRHADLVCFLTSPGHTPAAAVALHARGVRWSHAVGVWSASDIAALTDETPALGFVDEILSPDAGDQPAGLFRPLRPLASSPLAGLALP